MANRSIQNQNLSGQNSILFVFFIVSLFCSCSGETVIADVNNSKLLSFSVSVPFWKGEGSASKAESRATPITDPSLGTDKSFNLIADRKEGTGNYGTLIDNNAVTCSNNLWKTATDYYWSGTDSKTVNFYAYYPASIPDGTITHTAGSAPTLAYTVPDDASSQPDILAVSSPDVSGSTVTAVPLSFKHILAAVKFSVGAGGMPGGTITKITLNNIQYKGTYSFDGTWTQNTTDLKSFSLTVSASTNASTTITSGPTTFMMIPQTLSDASVMVAYSNGGTLAKAITGTWEAGKIYNYNLSYPPRTFDYTGTVQSYIVPVTGIYKVECWGAGASGEDNLYYNSGRGGYTMGDITLTEGTMLYVYVGQEGGAFNGGGTGETSGGGATDIRLIANEWNDFNSLKSRIMVAGGGGGGYYSSTTKDGICPDAGGLKGTDAYCVYTPDGGTNYSGHGGTQTSGGKCGSTSSICDPYTPNADGHFGYGGIGKNYNNVDWHMSSGGGGGYYGGGHGVHPGNGWTGGGGGSSFISGYPGCNAISESSTSTNIIHTGSPDHYSGYVFTNMQMIAGYSTMPAPSGGTETGHTGNGYARITFISAN